MLPLLSSSPMLSSPILGADTFMIRRAYASPITAKLRRSSAEQSADAPASSISMDPAGVGIGVAAAGLRTSLSLPRTVVAPMTNAPVFPADITPDARPSLTSLTATIRLEFFLFLIA